MLSHPTVLVLFIPACLIFWDLLKCVQAFSQKSKLFFLRQGNYENSNSFWEKGCIYYRTFPINCFFDVYNTPMNLKFHSWSLSWYLQNGKHFNNLLCLLHNISRTDNIVKRFSICCFFFKELLSHQAVRSIIKLHRVL